jgi:hypothetical protein
LTNGDGAAPARRRRSIALNLERALGKNSVEGSDEPDPSKNASYAKRAVSEFGDHLAAASFGFRKIRAIDSNTTSTPYFIQSSSSRVMSTPHDACARGSPIDDSG